VCIGQVIMGGCIRLRMAAWKRVALTRAFALGPSILVAVLTSSDQSVFSSFNEYLNILQSVQLPFAMLPVLHFAGSAALLGRFRSHGLLLVVSIVLALLVMAINVILIIQFIDGYPAWAIGLVCLYGIFYFSCCSVMIADELARVRAAACATWRRVVGGRAEQIVVGGADCADVVAALDGPQPLIAPTGKSERAI